MTLTANHAVLKSTCLKLQGENKMNNQNNPETYNFNFEEVNRKEERRKYNRIMRTARNVCPISYDKFCRLLKYKYNINYFGTKNLTNRYVDDLISIGKLKKSEDGTLTIAEVKQK